MRTCKNCGLTDSNTNESKQPNVCPYCGHKYEFEHTDNYGETSTPIQAIDNFNLDYQQNRKKYWLSILLYFAIFYIGAVIIQFLLSVILLAIGDYGELNPDSINYKKFEIDLLAWSNVLVYIVAIAAITPIICHTLKNDLQNFKLYIGNNFKWFAIGICIMYAGVYISSIIISIISFVFGLQPGESSNQATIETIMTSNSLNGTMMCIMTICFAPFLEEIIFRRCLFGIFKEKAFITVIFSAVIFAGIHTIPTCLMMIPDLFTGAATPSQFFLEFLYILNYMGQAFALSFVYYKTKGNLIPCIMIHVFNNIIATIGILVTLLF